MEAFARVNDGFSLDRVIADPELNRALADQCRVLGLPGEARAWNLALFNLRKRGRLAEIATQRRTDIDWRYCDAFLFASEIAWRELIEKGAKSLDEILCDPALASEFDCAAAQLRPDSGRWNIAGRRSSFARWHRRRSTRAKLLKPGRFKQPMKAFTSAPERRRKQPACISYPHPMKRYTSADRST